MDRFYMKLRPGEVNDAHTRVTVFTGNNLEHTFANCGRIVMDTKHFEMLKDGVKLVATTDSTGVVVLHVFKRD
jgi:hypothetical protein